MAGGNGGTVLNSYAHSTPGRRWWTGAAVAAAALTAALPALGCSSARATGTRPPATAAGRQTSGTPAPAPAQAALAVRMPEQAPAGHWSYGSVTVRGHAAGGRLSLWFEEGKGPDDGTRAQWYDDTTRRWRDIGTRGSGQDFFAPPAGSPARPVRLRIMPYDGDTVTTLVASYDDGRRHSWTSPDRRIRVVAPTVAAGGLRTAGEQLVAGGRPTTFTLQVRNPTRVSYPGVHLRYNGYAWNTRSGAATSYRGLHIQQYDQGRWTDVRIASAAHRAGFTAVLAPAAGRDLPAGTTVVYRLRIWAERAASPATTELDGAFLAGGPGDHWQSGCGVRFSVAHR